MIMSAKEGRVDKWLVKEGEECDSGTPLCEVTLDDLTVSVDAPRRGIIAELLLPAGDTCKVDEAIVQLAKSKEAYLAYLDELRIEQHDKEFIEVTKEVLEEDSKKPDTKTLLREIRHLIDKKELDQSTDFVKKLLSLARKGNADLLVVFEGSYEGKAFNEETFDKKFFIDNARDVVEEQNTV